MVWQPGMAEWHHCCMHDSERHWAAHLAHRAWNGRAVYVGGEGVMLPALPTQCMQWEELGCVHAEGPKLPAWWEMGKEICGGVHVSSVACGLVSCNPCNRWPPAGPKLDRPNLTVWFLMCIHLFNSHFHTSLLLLSQAVIVYKISSNEHSAFGGNKF